MIVLAVVLGIAVCIEIAIVLNGDITQRKDTTNDQQTQQTSFDFSRPHARSYFGGRVETHGIPVETIDRD